MPFLTKTPPAMTLSDVQSALTSVSELVLFCPTARGFRPIFT